MGLLRLFLALSVIAGHAESKEFSFNFGLGYEMLFPQILSKINKYDQLKANFNFD